MMNKELFESLDRLNSIMNQVSKDVNAKISPSLIALSDTLNPIMNQVSKDVNAKISPSLIALNSYSVRIEVLNQNVLRYTESMKRANEVLNQQVEKINEYTKNIIEGIEHHKKSMTKLNPIQPVNNRLHITIILTILIIIRKSE